MSLSHRVSDGGEITEEETAALKKLSAYAGSMTVRLAEMEAGLNTGAPVALARYPAACRRTTRAEPLCPICSRASWKWRRSWRTIPP